MIVLVGDNEGIETVQSSIEATGQAIDVVTAPNDEHLGRLEAERTDCVVNVVDPSGPSMLALVDRVRDVTSDLPFVVLVNDVSDIDVEAALDEGVTDVVERPTDDDQWTLLANRLREYGAGYRAGRQSGDGYTQRRFGSIVEHSPDAIIVHDEEGTILEANQRACHSLGYDREELLDAKIQDIEVGLEPTELEALWANAEADEPITVEGRHRRADGSEFPVQVSIGTIQLDGDEQFLGIARDISNRKERQRELRTFREAVQHAGHAVEITDADGEFVYVNPAFEAVTGYDADEVIGETPRILKSGEHDNQFYEDLWKTILAGEQWHGEIVNRRKDGTRYVVDKTIAPILGDDGEPRKFVGVERDVTERKEYERMLREQNEQLETQQERIQFFNSLLRHDVLNGMTVVQGNADVLLDELADDDDLRQIAESIYARSDDIVGLIQQVRSVLRRLTAEEDVELSRKRLATLVTDRTERIRKGHPETTIETTVPEDVSVVADDLLADVLHNVLMNAIQHNDRDDPAIDVIVTADESTAEIRVADNGPGVPDNRKDEIFRQGKGDPDTSTGGFGLFFVETMVERYGGDVWVENSDPRGAEFVIELPRA